MKTLVDVRKQLEQLRWAVESLKKNVDALFESLEEKKYIVNFETDYMQCARVVNYKFIGTNASGWVITGLINEAPVEEESFVNHFTAIHPFYGTIEGDFEHEVVAYGGKDAYDHFIEHHPYQEGYYE